MGALDLSAAYGTFFPTVFVFGLFVIYAARHETFHSLLFPGPSFLSAPQKITWRSLGLSLYASFMGNWVLFLPAVVGATYGWPGVIGYALSNALPYLLLMWLAPLIYRKTEGGFSSCDYLATRFGLAAQLAAACVSLCMMFATLSSELTTVGLSMTALSDGHFPLACAVVLVAAVPLVYVLVGGLRCCIVSDVVQAIVIVFLFLPFVVYLICTGSPVDVAAEGAPSPSPSGDAFIAGAVLVLSVWPIFLCDQGIWQRVWAARSGADVRKALLVAAVLSGFSVFLFGVAGIVCLTGADSGEGASLFAYAAARLPVPWVVVLCILALACVISSVDTYQAAIVSLIGKDLERFRLSFNWARAAMVLLNIPAVLLALYQVPLMSLFMVTNFLCTVLSGPFLVSVHPGVTTAGFLGGLACALVGLLLCGLCSNAAIHNPFSLSFFATDFISTVPHAVCFAATPVIGAAATACISAIQHRLQPQTTTNPLPETTGNQDEAPADACIAMVAIGKAADVQQQQRNSSSNNNNNNTPCSPGSPVEI